MPEPHVRLSILIKFKGISSKHLAEVTGVSEATVSRWCNGRCIPRKSSIRLLVKELGGEVRDIFKKESVANV